MRGITNVAIRILILLIVCVLPCHAFAQTTRLPSVKEQLEAQYAPGTVLVISKEGILGVAPISAKRCISKY